ncbi:MAG TPA: alpha/beta hydrolase [Myxococcales bacterium]|nr:alpha/beta hydrolase [Myxococcales bacterium]
MIFTDAGAGNPVLFLHGFPCTRGLWDAVIPLMPGFRCIAPDLLGYGESRFDGEVGMAAQVAPLLSLLDGLGLARVDLVAHDVGTAAALLLALQAPERIRRLIVMDGVHETEWAMDAIESIRSWDLAKAARLQPVLARGIRPIRGLLQTYAGEEGGRRLIHAARCLNPNETAGATARLRASGLPIRVIWGSDDSYLPLERVGRPLAKELETELVVVTGGHFLPLDNPAGAAQAISEFLGG